MRFPCAAPARVRERPSRSPRRRADAAGRVHGLGQGHCAEAFGEGWAGSRAIAGVFGSVRELAPLTE